MYNGRYCVCVPVVPIMFCGQFILVVMKCISFVVIVTAMPHSIANYDVIARRLRWDKHHDNLN